MVNIESPEDSVLQKDIDAIVKNNDFAEMRGKTVFVSGATGLIGSQIVRTLAAYNRLKQYDTKVIAFVRNEEKANALFKPLIDRHDIEIIVGDINKPVFINEPIDYIIHTASPTASKYFVEHPVETVMTAVEGTKNMLELARDKKISAMIYLSSLEVYGIPNGRNDTIKENDYGYIDILNVRSSYSEGKKLVECLCASYASEYHVPIKIARLSQTFGAGVNYHDNRVFAEFIRCAIENQDIILHTQGRTERTYCYTRDAITGILTILTRGKSGEAYNVTNKDTAISIRNMAEMVAELFGNKIKVHVEIPEDIDKYGYNPEMIIRLNTDKLNALGWRAEVGLEEMFINTKKSIEERLTNGRK